MKALIKKAIPIGIWEKLSTIRQGLKRANITHSTGALDPFMGKKTFVMVVGPAFDQSRPDAMMACRMGYCRAFEGLGIPYVIADVRDVADLVQRVPMPFLMYFAGDLEFLSTNHIPALESFPSAVWVYPWFSKSRQFFISHGMNPKIWTLPERTIKKIRSLSPRFCFTATVPSGLHFFEEWERCGIPVKSYPLACDAHVYHSAPIMISDFDNVPLGFVGGYWQSKGKEIDRYLRQFESRLHVYGYSKWPYAGYRGKLPLEYEASFYHQARVCPVINEPTVALLKGQINERVFKVLGSMGCPVVDAVSAYRELYSEDELLVSDGPEHFAELVEDLLKNEEMNCTYRNKGNKATIERHTYEHRAVTLMDQLGLGTDKKIRL